MREEGIDEGLTEEIITNKWGYTLKKRGGEGREESLEKSFIFMSQSSESLHIMKGLHARGGL